MKLTSILLSAAFLVAAEASLRGAENDSPSIERRSQSLVRNKTIASFPRMYTAVVPCPGTASDDASSAQKNIHFTAEVDLIDIVEWDMPAPYNGTRSSFCRISFLVRNSNELRRIELLTAAGAPRSAVNGRFSTAFNLQQDFAETNRMYQSLADSNFFQLTRSIQSYATITDFQCYRSLAGMKSWMDDMVSKAQQIPNLSIKINVFGKSYNGYNMTALVLTGNGVSAAGRSTNKAPMFIMAGIHAREYAPPELVARWAEYLVNGYSTDADITSILDHTEIHLVLESNPDGRQIAETNRNVWQRKNTHDYSGKCGTSGGVDLNRNFPFKWGLGSGSSSDPCAETYRGPSAASEPEVKAIVEYTKALFPTDQRKTYPEGNQLGVAYPQSAKGVFMDIHSYKEIMIFPWSFRNSKGPNDYAFEALVNKCKHFNGYALSGPTRAAFLYLVSGGSNDWAYGTLGAAAMSFEIGTSFYQDCNYFNKSIVPKNIGALTYAAKIASAPYLLPKGPDVISITFGATSVAANGTLKVSVTASDLLWSAEKFDSSKQGIASVRLWVDVHPYDIGCGSGILVSGFPSSSDPGTGAYNIQASSYSVGRHTIYFEATDKGGIKGPISAAYFLIVPPTPNPTISPVISPAPTNAPTKTPTKAPTKTPTKAPTKTSTKAPIVKAPTKAPA